jgi:Ca2+-binding RTX toxin-like protein
MVSTEPLTLSGSNNSNRLTGGAGNDTISGNGGNDTLVGGLGNDTLTGGAGRDFFEFSSPLGVGNVDRITDFNVADDTINLSNAMFTAFGNGTGNLNAAAFKSGTQQNWDASDRILYERASGNLYYDPTGNGGNDVVHFATLNANLGLTAADFRVIA